LSRDPDRAPSSAEMRAFAYRLLGRREYSLHELEQRLRQKWPEAAEIGELVEALAGENLVSDERFTESFVRSRIARHQGPRKIQAELRGKGVSEHLVAKELDRQAGAWTDLARDWLRRQHPGELDFAARQKYYRRLCNRGFTHDQAMDALNSPT
jgi:regulatory protein